MASTPRLCGKNAASVRISSSRVARCSSVWQRGECLFIALDELANRRLRFFVTTGHAGSGGVGRDLADGDAQDLLLDDAPFPSLP